MGSETATRSQCRARAGSRETRRILGEEDGSSGRDCSQRGFLPPLLAILSIRETWVRTYSVAFPPGGLGADLLATEFPGRSHASRCNRGASQSSGIWGPGTGLTEGFHHVGFRDDGGLGGLGGLDGLGHIRDARGRRAGLLFHHGC